MKLNKKIVTGLATAALFAPLALNNVQVSANVSNGGDTAIDKESNQHITKQQVINALKEVGASEDALNANITNNIQSNNIKDVINLSNEINNVNSDDNKKNLFYDFLNKYNTNSFIQSFTKNNASDILSKIHEIVGQSNDIKDQKDSYKQSELSKLLESKNSELDSNSLKFDSSVITNSESINTIKNNVNDMSSGTKSNETDKFNTLKQNNSSNFIKLNSEDLNSESSIGDLEANGSNKKSVNDIFNKVEEINTKINSIKNPQESDKENQLKDLLNRTDSSKFNSSNVSGNFTQIVDSINNLDKLYNQVNAVSTNNDVNNNKNSLFKYALNKNNINSSATNISNLLNDGDNISATNVVNKLIDLYNNPSKYQGTSNSANQQPNTTHSPVVVTSNNNSNSNSNNTNQSSKPTETNNSHEVQFPSAPKSDNVVKTSHATKVNNAKSDVKKAEKQLANAKSNKAKNNAAKSINKAKANLAKLNGDQKSTLKDAKNSVKKAEKQLKKAKTSDAQKSANASLKAAQTNYTQLNKYIK